MLRPSLPALLATLIALAACAPAVIPAPRPAATASPPAAAPGGAQAPTTPVDFKVGVVLSLTGAAGVYGDPQKKGIELALEEINRAGGIRGGKLTAVIEDDKSDPNQATAAFQKLIDQDKVAAILGPTLSNSALSADKVAQAAKVPVLAVSNTGNGIVEIGDFIFRNSLSEAQVIPTMINTVKLQFNPKRVALLYGSDDAFTKASGDAFKSAILTSQLPLVIEETFTRGEADFAPKLEKIKSYNPDTIVVSALADEGIRILQQKAAAGIPDSVRIIGGNGFNSPAVIKAAGPAAEGLMTGAAWHITLEEPLNQDFVQAYRAKYQANPDQFAAQAFAGTYIMGNAIARVATDAGVSGEKLRDALKATNLKTVLGDFTFTPDRNARHKPVVQEVKNGAFVLVK